MLVALKHRFLVRNKKRWTVFIEELQKRNKVNPVSFDTFYEYLHRLNVNVFKEVGIQLEENGFDASDLENILTYLNHIKENRNLFIALLKELIK